MNELRDTQDYELTKEETDEAYLDIAEQLKYDVLGIPQDEKADQVIEQLKDDLGTLASQNWKRYQRRKPDKETDKCWFITNIHVEDKTEAPKLLCRSLSTLRLQLSNAKIANRVTIRNEWQNRADGRLSIKKC